MKLVITGGLGFIGSNLIHYWSTKYPKDEILNLDSYTYAANEKALEGYKVITENVDIRNKAKVSDVFNSFKPELVIHLAACSHVDRSISSPREFVETNVLGTYNLMEASKEVEIKRFHHVSTDEVYGSLGIDDSRFTEETPYDPSSIYSATKAGSDHLVRAWYRTHGFPVTISNCSNNFGPWQNEEKLIPTVINCFRRGEKVPVYGTGANIRDWIFVEDHVKAIDQIIKCGVDGETYNVGGDCEKTNIEIIDLIAQLMEKRNGFKDLKRLINFVEDRPGHDFRYAIDSNKVKSTCEWKPSKNFKENLAKTIDWYLGKWEIL